MDAKATSLRSSHDTKAPDNTLLAGTTISGTYAKLRDFIVGCRQYRHP